MSVRFSLGYYITRSWEAIGRMTGTGAADLHPLAKTLYRTTQEVKTVLYHHGTRW